MIIQAQAGNKDAEQKLMKNHTALIHVLANRLNPGKELYEELLQAGKIGLINAIRHYRPDSRAKLITYAYPWIIGELKSALKNYTHYCMFLQPYDEEHTFPSYSINLEYIDLQIALEHLSEVEKKLILLRYFRDKTQSETALLLHRSQAQISKIERKALKRLEEYLSN